MKPIDPSDPLDSWLLDRFRLFIELGLFEQFSAYDESDFFACPEIQETRTFFHNNPNIRHKDHAEFFILQSDIQRMIGIDLETDDHEGDDFYCNLVKYICDISRGVISVSTTSELWQQIDESDYSVTIRFTIDNKQYEVTETHIRDWAGVGRLFALLDEILNLHGTRLWYLKMPSQCVHMIVMTESVKNTLEEKTELRFSGASRKL